MWGLALFSTVGGLFYRPPFSTVGGRCDCHVGACDCHVGGTDRTHAPIRIFAYSYIRIVECVLIRESVQLNTPNRGASTEKRVKDKDKSFLLTVK